MDSSYSSALFTLRVDQGQSFELPPFVAHLPPGAIPAFISASSAEASAVAPSATITDGALSLHGAATSGGGEGAEGGQKVQLRVLHGAASRTGGVRQVLLGETDATWLVGRTHEDGEGAVSGAAAAGQVGTSLVLGVFKRKSKELHLLPLAAPKVVRMEARVKAVAYDAERHTGGAAGAVDERTASAVTGEPLSTSSSVAKFHDDLRKRRLLTATFGSKKSKSMVAAMERGQVSGESLKASDALGHLVRSVAAAPLALTLADLEAQQSAPSYLPPHNPAATQVEEAYPLAYLVPRDEWESTDVALLLAAAALYAYTVKRQKLKGQAKGEKKTGRGGAEEGEEKEEEEEEERMEMSDEKKQAARRLLKKLPTFVKERLGLLLTKTGASQTHYARLLLHIHFLVLMLHIPDAVILPAAMRTAASSGPTFSSSALPSPQLISKEYGMPLPTAVRLPQIFRVQADDAHNVGGKKYKFPSRLRQLLVSYIAALALHATSFRVPLIALAGDLKMAAPILMKHLREMGCESAKGGAAAGVTETVAVLRVPLKFPDPPVGRRKRK
ncbi:hypothetical protein CLOM_g1981 [Closterium sp. NIES-68]|nr:hypothetical protein CLOM_g1981 [Closterium sp. NIES-68]GJP63523.1 hypothetical protein CLOP_g20590 [Closterium sp. NIES-67]